MKDTVACQTNCETWDLVRQLIFVLNKGIVMRESTKQCEANKPSCEDK